jgi:hypothetical protein
MGSSIDSITWFDLVNCARNAKSPWHPIHGAHSTTSFGQECYPIVASSMSAQDNSESKCGMICEMYLG